MTEPMNRSEAKQILVNAIGKECVFSIDGKVWNTGNLNANLMIDAMQEYAAQQVAQERERMKKELGKSIIEHEYELDFPGETIINVSVLFKLIDSL